MTCVNSVTVYTKDNCPTCNEVKSILESQNICVIEKKIGLDLTVDEMFDELGKVVRSVPQVVAQCGVKEEYIGSIAEVKKAIANGLCAKND